MRDALRPILSCALIIALSAAVHGQLVGTKFEKYTRFLTALILLSLLIRPMLNLFRIGGDLLEQTNAAPGQTEQTDPGIPEISYADALLSVLQRQLEDDVRSTLRTECALAADAILKVQVTLDGGDPEAIRVEAVTVQIRGSADSAEIERILSERYGCENVSVIGDA